MPRAGPADLLCRAQWLPGVPLGLDDLVLTWDGEPHPTVPYGAAAEHVRPVRADGGRYASYADAVAAVDPPELLENRPCYRLLDASLTGRPEMRYLVMISRA